MYISMQHMFFTIWMALQHVVNLLQFIVTIVSSSCSTVFLYSSTPISVVTTKIFAHFITSLHKNKNILLLLLLLLLLFPQQCSSNSFAIYTHSLQLIQTFSVIYLVMHECVSVSTYTYLIACGIHCVQSEIFILFSIRM